MNSKQASAALEFGCEGVTVRVRARGAEAIRALGRLAEDFERFGEIPTGARGIIEMDLSSPRAGALPRGPTLFRAASCRIFGLGPRRDCEYSDGTVLLSKRLARGGRARQSERFEILGDAAAGIHEAAWEAILSALGEALDRAGIHRVHALGLEGRGKGGLLLLPSGGGKSTLAALLVRERLPGLRILSEETPLVSRRGLLPFPVRLALAPELARSVFPGAAGRIFPRRRFPAAKELFPLEASMIGKPARPAFLIVGGLKRAPRAAITPVPRRAALFELLVSLVIGYGVAQMKEHLLRLDNLPSLVRIAFSRLAAAVRLAATVPAYRLVASPYPEETLSVLKQFLALEGCLEADIIPVGHDSSEPFQPRPDLHQAIEGPDLGESQIPLPAHDRGVSLGSPEPADHVRRSEHDLPLRP
jgi:hypothetical protein